MDVRHCLTNGYIGTMARSRGRVVSVPCRVGAQPQNALKIRRFRVDTLGILAICVEMGYDRNAKTKQTCSTRVFGIQYAFYGMSVGGEVCEIRLPVSVTFFKNVASALYARSAIGL